MIMVLSGTRDGRELTDLLLAEKYKIIAAAATDYGANLMAKHENLTVSAGRMNQDQIRNFILDNRIAIVIDATHPYAEEISQNTLAACKETEIPYLRYQRQASGLEEYSHIIKVAAGYEEAAQILKEVKGNILLSTGSKSLKVFTEVLEVNRLFARVLPTSDVIKKCEELGLLPSNIIAMQGPFSEGMNEEIIRKYDIEVLLTKESGDTGGTLCKLRAAHKMNIPVIMIERPRQSCENVYESKEELIKKVGEIYGRILSHNG